MLTIKLMAVSTFCVPASKTIPIYVGVSVGANVGVKHPVVRYAKFVPKLLFPFIGQPKWIRSVKESVFNLLVIWKMFNVCHFVSPIFLASNQSAIALLAN